MAGMEMGSSTSSASSRAQRSKEWTWWDEVHADQSLPGGGARPWRCKLCNYHRIGGVDKVRAHFLHQPGKQVKFCPNVSLEKKAQLLENVAKQTERASASGRRTPNVAIDPSLYGHANPTPSSSGLEIFRHHAHASSSQRAGTRLENLGVRVHASPASRQASLHGMWDQRKKDEVDAAVARFFYHDHIPFNVARSTYFHDMIAKVAHYGPTYKPPSSEYLRTTLLEKEKAAIEIATTNIRDQWERNGVTLIGDGWSDMRSRSVHGVVAYSRGDVYFLASYDASSVGKSADVLASEWIEAMEIVGSQHVIQFVADGENANRFAGRVLEDRYPHVTFTPCFAHCLNNLLKDIAAMHFVSNVMDKCNRIITFICNHQFLLAEFRKRSQKELLKYSETRFAYNYLMLARLYKCKGALRELFASEAFESHATFATLNGNLCSDYVSDKEFWVQVARIKNMVKPIIHLMRLCDSMQPCIGKIYEGMDSMIEKLQQVVPDRDEYELVKAACIARWDAYDSPLHGAAYVLDPEFQGKYQERDVEVSAAWNTVLCRLVPDRDEQRKIRNQLSLYRQKHGMFGTQAAQEDRIKVGAAL